MTQQTVVLSVSRTVRSRMQELGLFHAKDLAEVTGLSVSAAYQLVNAQGNPTVKTLVQIALTLDIPLEQLFGGGRHA